MLIHKYPLKLTERQGIELPAHARILDVQMQGTSMVLWALFSPNILPNEEREISIYGTGNPLPPVVGHHISTVQDCGFVWHIFETTGIN